MLEIKNLEDLINMCLEKKEMKLKYELENNVNLVSFSNMNIEISINDKLNKNFIKDLSEKMSKDIDEMEKMLNDYLQFAKTQSQEETKKINLKENRFGFEPEITAKIAKRSLRIYEVGISYFGRKYADGKKITWKDGFSAIRCILKYNLWKKY